MPLLSRIQIIGILSLLLSHVCCFNFTYNELPYEYQLLIPKDIFNSVLMSANDEQVIHRIYEEFDSPIPIENITAMLHPVAPIFEDKMLGFVEKVGFQLDILKVSHPREEYDLDVFEHNLDSFLLNEAVDFFAFTPQIDIKTFQQASAKYGPLAHVRMDEMNSQINQLLPNVARSLANLTTEFEGILNTLADSMLDLQLEVLAELKKRSVNVDFAEVEKAMKEHVYELVPETLAGIEKVLPFAMINAMHEIRYKQMEQIWRIYREISTRYNLETGLNVSDFHSFDVDFLGWITRRMLNNALDSLIAHKKFTLVRDLTQFGTRYTVPVDDVLEKTNFMSKMEAVHEELNALLDNRLNFLLLCAIGSVPRAEHRYVKRLVAHYLPGEQLLTKTTELYEHAPYLTGKVFFGASRCKHLVKRYCYNHHKSCNDLNRTTDFVKNYYIRGMIRIFDLLPEDEISNIKKVQTKIKLEKYRYVMVSLAEKCRTLYKAIENVHLKIENKFGAMSELGTQEFVRKLEADTLRVILLLGLGRNEDAEDYREYARSWSRGFTSLTPAARAEIAVALPDFAKALTTSGALRP